MSLRTSPAENIPLLDAEELEEDEGDDIVPSRQPSSSAAATLIDTSQQPSTAENTPIRDYTAPPCDDELLEAPPGYDAPAWSNSVSLEVDLEALAGTATQLPRFAAIWTYITIIVAITAIAVIQARPWPE
jgi:hypothetical protein